MTEPFAVPARRVTWYSPVGPVGVTAKVSPLPVTSCEWPSAACRVTDTSVAGSPPSTCTTSSAIARADDGARQNRVRAARAVRPVRPKGGKCDRVAGCRFGTPISAALIRVSPMGD